METIMRVCEIEKYYGQKEQVKKVLDRLSFEVKKGEFVGIMGASGSGKTTLLNVLSTIDTVTSGHIFYGETDITELCEDALADFRKYNLGYIFQDFNLLDTLTAEENIILAMALQKKSRSQMEETIGRLAKTLGITDILKKFPYELSGGQKQRCACARALVNSPKLIFADEPTGNLDKKTSEEILHFLLQIQKSFSFTILLVTHDLDLARCADTVFFMEDGRLSSLSGEGDFL